MAKLTDVEGFDAFAGATPPVAPSAQSEPEPPKEPPVAEEAGPAPKRAQRAAQRRPEGNTTEAPPPPAPEPAEAPDRPPMTRAQEARWELVLQSAAGKARKSREAADQAEADFRELVAEARAADVPSWRIDVAALRGGIDLSA